MTSAVRARGRHAARDRGHPKNLTQEFHKTDRGRRILVDTGRNGWSATHAAAYAVRAKAGAPVSAPCTWEELESGKVGPADVHVAEHGGAPRQGGGSLGDMKKRKRSLKRPIEKLLKLGEG